MPEPQQPQSIKLHYLKSGGYRAIHVDGAVCGPMPSGRGLHIAFFSERAAIPQIVDQAINQDGTLGKELVRVGREGFVREIEVDAFMDVVTAKALVALLSTKIAEIERMLAQHNKS